MALTCIAVGADGRGGPAAPPGGPQCVSLRAVFRPTSRATASDFVPSPALASLTSAWVCA